jgi:hypothetical protein
MDVAALPALSDSRDIMTKAPYLSRRLAKEKTTCPGCNKAMQVGTLAWSHKCRVAKAVPEHVVQERLDKMLHNAHKSFKCRQEGGSDCPMTGDIGIIEYAEACQGHTQP